jgi:hypothetical protein
MSSFHYRKFYRGFLACCFSVICPYSFADGGVSAIGEFTRMIVISSVVWVLVTALVGWLWYRSTRRRFVLFLSPFVVSVVIVTTGGLGAIVTVLFTRGRFPSNSDSFFAYFFLLIVGTILFGFWYRRRDDMWRDYTVISTLLFSAFMLLYLVLVVPLF